MTDVAAQLIPVARSYCALKDWEQALRAAEELRNKCPNEEFGYEGTLIALRALRRFDEAAQFLEDHRKPYAAKLWWNREAASLEQARGNHLAALKAAQSLIDHFPSAMMGYHIKLIALRELRRFDEAQIFIDRIRDVFVDKIWFLVDISRIAASQEKWAEAANAAERLRLLFPEAPQGYHLSIPALKSLEHFDEADSVCQEAVRRFPLQDWAWVQYGKIAEQRAELAEADRRYAEGIARLPDSLVLWLAYATRRGDDPLNPGRRAISKRVLERIEDVLRRFPSSGDALAVKVEQLASVGRLIEAEAVLAKGGVQPAESLPIARIWARLPELSRDYEEAMRRYSKFMECFPTALNAYVGLAESLCRLGRHEEAERVCTTGLELLGPSANLVGILAQTKADQGQFSVAVEILTRGIEQFPGTGRLEKRLFNVQMELASRGMSPVQEATTAAASADGAGDIVSILKRFQSLGGTQPGCEFGLVQRHYGFEPLGLLRWGQTTIATLITALDQDFEGIDQEEDVNILENWLNAEQQAEYMWMSRRYGFSSHTFLYSKDISAEQVHRTMRRRMMLLKRMLLSDIESGEYIFVHRQGFTNPSFEEIERLHDALCCSRRNTLFYVVTEAMGKPNGTVELRRPGLIIGYIDRFAVVPGGMVLPIRYDSWSVLCRKAHALWRSGQ